MSSGFPSSCTNLIGSVLTKNTDLWYFFSKFPITAHLHFLWRQFLGTPNPAGLYSNHPIVTNSELGQKVNATQSTLEVKPLSSGRKRCDPNWATSAALHSELEVRVSPLKSPTSDLKAFEMRHAERKRKTDRDSEEVMILMWLGHKHSPNTHFSLHLSPH